MLSLLIVEDQPAVREVVAEIAGELSEDAKVTQVGSLEEARAALTSEQWGGLITDMSLGDGNVLELIAKLNEEGVMMPPTILMSGFLTSARMAQALQLGIEHVLAKPFAPDVLLECLEKMLSQHPEAAAPAVKPKRPIRSADRLLPEMFEMDRRMGLVYRMFDEIPAHHDVSSVCASALNLAVEVVHAKGGYLAFFERNQHKLVMVAQQGIGDVETSCSLDATHFKTLISGEEELIQSSDEAPGGECWPGLNEPHHIAIPVRLQGVCMGVLCLLEPASKTVLKSETKQILGLLVKELDTLLDNRAVHAALADNMRETLIALVRSLEARDRYTRDHSGRVGALSAVFAEDLGLEPDHVDLIRTGGLLHDIGKCGIPDAVLLKPGRYSDEEFAIMKAHPAIGDNILQNMDTMVRERLMLRHHHERYDGLGYPDQLAGEDIPFEARIVCVADAIDAMTTHRVYRMARPLSFCLEQLKKGSGTQFDPRVVEVAIAAIERGVVHTQAEAQHELEGVMPISALITVKTEVRNYG
ncbi:two-component system response regulator [Mariprofundus micogutta]|uniref:Two-component system response regulator n=1 Tax=Mariprofundus micogutta TaxID=1921010 RepID=A0A1L8CME7_9PROT|nr:HD domain-containing phosphohydrolase [Mariprofundus micogutta]GAV20019.1 two-component system response regulator [Mariprofundus micogutta]